MTSQKRAVAFLTIGLLAFVTLSMFGLGHMGGMEVSKDGNMKGCIFTGKTMLCKMGIVEHISLWQSMFTAMTPQKANALALLVLLAVVFVAVAIFKRNLFLLFNYYATKWRLYIRHNSHLSLFNPLKEAFSQGILNPKIYEFAIL